MATQPQVESSLIPPGIVAPVARHRAAWQAPDAALRAPVAGSEHLVNGHSWHESHVVDAPLHAKLILLIDALAFTRECTLKCLTTACPEITIRSFSNVQDCLDYGLGAGRACVILY